MNAPTPTTRLAAAGSALPEMPFEGSPLAAQLIAALQDFLHGELADLARSHGIDHEHSPDKALLRQARHRLVRERFAILTPEQLQHELARATAASP